MLGSAVPGTIDHYERAEDQLSWDRAVDAARGGTARSPCTAPDHLFNDAMTPEEIASAFHRAVQLRDGSAFDLVAEDLVQHAAGPQGRDGLRQTVATLDHDLDHPTTTIHRVVAQGELVVVHLTMHGRHVASTMPLLAGLPPTGDAVAWEFMHIWRVAGGSLVEHWACRDDVGLLAQVGGWPRR